MGWSRFFAATLLFVGVAIGGASCGSNVEVSGQIGSVSGTAGSGENSGTSGTSGSGGSMGYSACDGPGQCVLAPKGCCPVCGTPELADFAAINQTELTAFQEATCPSPQPCPSCTGASNPNLFAYCASGVCTAADVRTNEVSACSKDTDCTLRFGSACCEGCIGTLADLVSVMTSSDLTSLVCAPSEECGLCLPSYPSETDAECVNGHCVVDVEL